MCKAKNILKLHVTLPSSTTKLNVIHYSTKLNISNLLSHDAYCQSCIIGINLEDHFAHTVRFFLCMRGKLL